MPLFIKFHLYIIPSPILLALHFVYFSPSFSLLIIFSLFLPQTHFLLSVSLLPVSFLHPFSSIFPLPLFCSNFLLTFSVITYLSFIYYFSALFTFSTIAFSILTFLFYFQHSFLPLSSFLPLLTRLDTGSVSSCSIHAFRHRPLPTSLWMLMDGSRASSGKPGRGCPSRNSHSPRHLYSSTLWMPTNGGLDGKWQRTLSQKQKAIMYIFFGHFFGLLCSDRCVAGFCLYLFVFVCFARLR